MESFRTQVSVPSLPPDVPAEVHLFDQEWMADQRSQGARLELCAKGAEQTELSPEEARHQEDRMRSLEASLAAAQLEIEYLQRELAEAGRPRWKRIIGNS